MGRYFRRAGNLFISHFYLNKNKKKYHEHQKMYLGAVKQKPHFVRNTQKRIAHPLAPKFSHQTDH